MRCDMQRGERNVGTEGGKKNKKNGMILRTRQRGVSRRGVSKEISKGNTKKGGAGDEGGG